MSFGETALVHVSHFVLVGNKGTSIDVPLRTMYFCTMHLLSTRASRRQLS